MRRQGGGGEGTRACHGRAPSPIPAYLVAKTGRPVSRSSSTVARHRQPSPIPSRSPAAARFLSSASLVCRPLSLTQPPSLGQKSSCSPCTARGSHESQFQALICGESGLRDADRRAEFSSSVSVGAGSLGASYSPETSSRLSQPSSRSGVGGSGGASGPKPRTVTLGTSGSIRRSAAPICSPQKSRVAACSSSSHSGASEVIEVPTTCERSSQWKAQPITSIVTGSSYARYASSPRARRSMSASESAVVMAEVSSACTGSASSEVAPFGSTAIFIGRSVQSRPSSARNAS